MLLKKLLKATLPLSITFLIHMIAWKGFDIYTHVPNIDFIEHFIGGFVTSWTLYNLLLLGTKKWRWKVQPKFLVYFLIVSGTMLVATLWEFHEYIHDVLFPIASSYQLGQGDTMHDYFMALLGAVAWCGTVHMVKKPHL